MDILTDITNKLSTCQNLFEAEAIILHWSMSLAQLAMKAFLEGLDHQLVELNTKESPVNAQPRTITFCFGPVTFTRHYFRSQGFSLDNQLKIKPRRRLSSFYEKMMAKVAQTTTMRNTANILNLLFDSGVTVDSVITAVHRLGKQVAMITQQEEEQVSYRTVPDNLTIEGDAFGIKSQRHLNQPSQLINVHHFRVYENHNGCHVNQHDFTSLGHLDQIRSRVINYLDSHYCLQGQTIFLGSDAGPGYQPARMLELVPAGAHGEFILDRYHCLRKIENTLGHQSPLTHQALRALKRHDYYQMTVVLDTAESLITDSQCEEQLQRLKAYLHRNWSYIPSPQERGYQSSVHLGSVESSHRVFTYRMKKQGKSWSKAGAQAMLGLIEAKTNDILDDGLDKALQVESTMPDTLAKFGAKHVSATLRPYLKKDPVKSSCGVKHGRIVIDGPTSSPIGFLSKQFRE